MPLLGSIQPEDSGIFITRCNAYSLSGSVWKMENNKVFQRLTLILGREAKQAPTLTLSGKQLHVSWKHTRATSDILNCLPLKVIYILLSNMLFRSLFYAT